MVGFGMILGAAPVLLFSRGSAKTTITGASAAAAWIPLVTGAAMVFIGTLSKVLTTALLGHSMDPLSRHVIAGRKTAIRKGDFVVFHLGARPHKGVDAFFKWMGDAFEEICDELEAHPEYGCLGSEQFFGVTGGLLVQYWASLDALNAYARNKSNTHASPWAKLMKKGRESSDYGFYHEAFEVKDGKYDAIYVNCPPMLLGNCLGVELASCDGQYSSAAGRAGKTDGSDYPTDLGNPDY